MQLRIDHAQPSDAPVIAQMVGELLREIMAMVGTKAFGFHQEESEARARSWMTDEKYSVLLARDGVQPEPLGFLALYESFALYTEGRTARFRNSISVRRIARRVWARLCWSSHEDLGPRGAGVGLK